MSESHSGNGRGFVEHHGSPDGELFSTLPRSEAVRCDPILTRLAEYSEDALEYGLRIDVISEGSNAGVGQLAAAVRSKFETADTYDIIALAPRVLMLDTSAKIRKIWEYTDEALAPDGSLAVIDYRQTFEVSKPHAEVLFASPDFCRYLKPSGQQSYLTEADLARLENLIWVGR